ncbi:MAG: peptidoglycan-binding protein [Stenomitos frigidus ULC029]
MSPLSSSEPCLPVTNQSCQKPLLQRGASGIEVIEIQKLLINWSLYEGAVDSLFGERLEQAVRAFQKRVFLPKTGVVDTHTWRSLYTGAPPAMPLLQRGSAGEAVVLLQEALQAVGQTAIVVDGSFGHQTDTAVRHFQRHQGLVVDGVVASCTWLALSRAR